MMTDFFSSTAGVISFFGSFFTGGVGSNLKFAHTFGKTYDELLHLVDFMRGKSFIEVISGVLDASEIVIPRLRQGGTYGLEVQRISIVYTMV
jgi:hypothetical protein